MTEVKHNFLKSKMNKDLDPRLMPDGEYRDALNIGVNRSEGPDVGVIENIIEVVMGIRLYPRSFVLLKPQDNPLQALPHMLVELLLFQLCSTKNPYRLVINGTKQCQRQHYRKY